MKINRLALKAAVNKSLATNEAKHAEQLETWNKWLDTYEEKWVEEKSTIWLKAVADIEKAIQERKPVTESMLPSYHNNCYRDPEGRSHYVSDGRPTWVSKVYYPDKELVALNEVLDIIVDDEVTITDLNRLGITAKTLREAVLKLDTKQKVKS